MILVVDIGNTNIVFGLYSKSKLIKIIRIQTDIHKVTDWYKSEIKKLGKVSVESAVIASVVPKLNKPIKEAIKSKFGCKVDLINWKSIKGLKIALTAKEQVGVDRLVNAYAAYRLYGGKAVIIDFGTATTFCAVDEKGRYLGGAITSGLEIFSASHIYDVCFNNQFQTFLFMCPLLFLF